MGLDVGTRNGLLSVRTDSTPTRSSKRVNVGERGTTVNWRSILATKIRLENGNDKLFPITEGCSEGLGAF